MGKNQEGKNERSWLNTEKIFEEDISISNNNIIHRVVNRNRHIVNRTLMLYHNIKNSDEDTNIEQSINEH